MHWCNAGKILANTLAVNIESRENFQRGLLRGVFFYISFALSAHIFYNGSQISSKDGTEYSVGLIDQEFLS